MCLVVSQHLILDFTGSAEGIDTRLGENMINGVSTARPDTGMVDFSTWGGLNEITRYPEIALNHSPSEYGFGGVGSVFYKNTKAK